MAQGLFPVASPSTSHDIDGVKSRNVLPINGKTYKRGETSRTQSSEDIENGVEKHPIGVVGENIITNQNPATTEVDPIDNDNIITVPDINTQIVSLGEEEPSAMTVGVKTENSMKIEIVKSILYGGLTELITSLGIVTSASNTKDTATRKVVAVSLATMITELFVTTYKMSELWINKNKTEEEEAEASDRVGSYENVLGDRKNYCLHFTVAIISFVVFGLVPPLVYGFSFNKPEDKLLKISTVTLVTVFCTVLLAVGKVYIERPSNWVECVNIIGKYIVDAIGTSILTTFGGNLIENYIESNGLFQTTNQQQSLFQPAIMSFENATWGPY